MLYNTYDLNTVACIPPYSPSLSPVQPVEPL